MIYALLDRNTDIAIREAIAQAIQNQNAAILKQYAVAQGVIRHIRDIQPRERFYCIYCFDGVVASQRDVYRGQRAANPWYFMHSNNNQCIGEMHNLGNGAYLNPKRQGCYIQLGLQTYPHTACYVRQAVPLRPSYCHHAFSIICPR